MKRILTLFFIHVFLFSFAQGSGNTIEFDGTGTSVSLGDQVASNVRTIEMWFKLNSVIDNSLAEPQALIARDFDNGAGSSTNEFNVCFTTNALSGGVFPTGTLMFTRRVGTTLHIIGSDINTWPADTWIHVAAVIDPTTGMKLYVNGIQQTLTDASVDPIQPQSGAVSDDVALGKWGAQNARFFDGDIDEVRIWDDARTENEIRANLCAKLLGTEPGLKAYYNFDNITGTTLPDETANTYDGTLSGFAAAPSVLSGAPLGDVSTYTYAPSLAGVTLNLVTTAGDVMEVSNINSMTSFGVHIYKVNQNPNSLTNVSNSVGNYYGVWLSGVDGTFDINYNITDYGCSSCFTLNERNDNSETTWTALNGAPSSCSFSFATESTVGDTYRAEYIVDQSPFDFDLGNDTLVCAPPLQIGQSFAGATYLWQDGTTTTPFYDVTATGTYYVDIDVQGCTGSDTIVVDVVDLAFDLGEDTTICGGTGTFGLSTGLSNAYTHQWQDGSSNNSYIVNSTGTYTVTVSEGACQNADTIEVELIDEPEIELGATQILCEGESVTLTNNNSTSIDLYLWSDGSNGSSLAVTQEGVYALYAENECGTDVDSVVVLVENCDCNIFIPNTFTPDGNAANDVFKVEGDCKFMVYQLEIFNRTGTLLFSSTDINDTWDGTYNGKLVPDGVYVYKIKYTTETIYSEYIHGHINVLR